MSFSIEKPNYLSRGLDGFLSKHQLEIHLGKHHQAYVDFLNNNVPSSEFNGKSVEDIVKAAPAGPMFNNAGQHFNHSFYWKSLTEKKHSPSAAVTAFLDKNFGGLEKFKEAFNAKASTVFGSGWCFLYAKGGKAEIGQFSNALNPLKEGGYPILCVDTWEHAWYIDYENRKMEYFKNFWTYVNWDFVEMNLKAAKLI